MASFFINRTAVLIIAALIVEAVIAIAPAETESISLVQAVTNPPDSNIQEKVTAIKTYDKSKNYALPKYILPENYKLELTPIFDEVEDPKKQFTFTGKVDIIVTSITKTKKVVMNARELQISVCNVFTTDATPKLLISDSGTVDEATEKLTILLEEELSTGTKYKIQCEFTGTLKHSDWKGFYLSSFKDGDKTVFLATTQFESSGARRAFPCFDEPGFKATYDVTLRNDPKYKTVISNTKTTSQGKIEGKLVTVFETTPRMSTYLLAFIVSDFQSYSPSRKNKDPKMTVYANKNLYPYAEQSYRFGRASIKAMEEYLDMDYQLYKLDQIGIPDFKSGAMENWGLVTYRETSFLFNPDEATTLNLNKIYTTITHEFVHQWFGNLVTPGWWKYIWLNEGFARYLQYMVTDPAVLKLEGDFVQKPWRTVEQFIVARHSAFQSDGLNSSRPMTYQAETPAEVNDLFDTITYAKAGSVLFMMDHILTTNVWKAGLKKYLTKFEYQVVEPKNLWDNLQEAYDEECKKGATTLANLGHVSVNDIGNSWSMETGYPVVTVTKKLGIVTLEQRRFQTDFKSNDLSKWIIPITYALESTLEADLLRTTPLEFLNRGSRSIQVKESEEFILVNNQQTGYYRVNYDNENWEKITKFVNDPANIKKLLYVTQAQLVDDSLNLGRGGYLSYSVILPLVKFLRNVTDYIPWEAAVTNFKILDVQLRGSGAENRYKSFNRELLSQVYNEIVNDYKVDPEDDHSLKLNRLNILKRACDFGVEECLKSALETLENDYLSQPKEQKMKPDVQEALYCGGARSGNDETYRNLLARYSTLTSPNEKKNLALGLGCFEDGDILNEILDEILKEDSLLKNDATSVYVGFIEAGTKSLEKVLNYFSKHHQHIEESIGLSNVDTIITSFGKYIATPSQLDKLTKIGNLNEETKKKVDRASEKAQERFEWNKKYLSEIEDWLKEQYNHASGVIVNLALLISGLLVSMIMRQ